MEKRDILQQLANTTISDEKSLKMIGRLIRKAFDETIDDATASELLFLAYKFNVPQFDDMLSDFEFENFDL